MVNRVDFCRIAEDAAHAVAHHRIVFPAAFQQLVHHLQIFVGIVITRIVIGLALMTDILCTALQIRGDDVPADTTFGQVIQRGNAAGKRIRMLKGERGGQAKAEVFGD